MLSKSRTKLTFNQANVIFSNELARRYGDHNIVSVSLNPGNLDSDLLRYKAFLKPIARVCILHFYLLRV